MFHANDPVSLDILPVNVSYYLDFFQFLFLHDCPLRKTIELFAQFNIIMYCYYLDFVQFLFLCDCSLIMKNNPTIWPSR